MWEKSKNKADFLGVDGLGLGILRNMQYEKHVEEKVFSFESGDILLLFTDGIVEAKNQKSQQFGFERVRSLVEVYQHLSPR